MTILRIFLRGNGRRLCLLSVQVAADSAQRLELANLKLHKVLSVSIISLHVWRNADVENFNRTIFSLHTRVCNVGSLCLFVLCGRIME